MFKFKNDLVIIDLEANQPSGTIIEIGAVRFTKDGNICSEKFSEIINPHEVLGTCRGGISITELTGITQSMVDIADDFPKIIRRFQKYGKSLGSEFSLASWGGWDIPSLRAECVKHGISWPFRGESFDIKSMVTFYSALEGKLEKKNSLKKMMMAWNLQQIGTAHRALPDAENTALLLKAVIDYHNENSIL